MVSQVDISPCRKMRGYFYFLNFLKSPASRFAEISDLFQNRRLPEWRSPIFICLLISAVFRVKIKSGYVKGRIVLKQLTRAFGEPKREKGGNYEYG